MHMGTFTNQCVYKRKRPTDKTSRLAVRLIFTCTISKKKENNTSFNFKVIFSDSVNNSMTNDGMILVIM